MIYLKSEEQIALMRASGKIVGDTLKLLEENIKAGISTMQLNKLAYDYITKCGAVPSFLNYNGYPASICVSVDSEVVHGIPSDKRIIHEGSIVSVDVGAKLNGYHADAARTFLIGNVDKDVVQLVKVTQESFFKAVEQVKVGNRISDISQAVYNYVTAYGYGVVRELCGHGIGTKLHEDPEVPNFVNGGRGAKIDIGMALAIEPMINLGTNRVEFNADGWTVTTLDHKPSAHYENTVVLTNSGVQILTL